VVPNRYFEMTLKILDTVTSQVGAYIRGQMLTALTIGVLTISGLYLLQWLTGIRIPYTYLIGIIAGFANLIPFVGPVMGMIPALIVYHITDQPIPLQFMHVVYIMLTFGAVQLLDNALVSPLIMSGSVGLHPLAVMVVIIIGGSLAGPLGMLLAVPTVAIVRVVLLELVWGLRRYRFL